MRSSAPFKTCSTSLTLAFGDVFFIFEQDLAKGQLTRQPDCKFLYFTSNYNGCKNAFTYYSRKSQSPKDPTCTNKVKRNSQRLMAECLKLVAILLTELLSSLCGLLRVRLACYSSFHHLSRRNKSRRPPGSQLRWSTRSPTPPFLPSFQPGFETARIPT